MIFYISDIRFGHKNVIGFSNRPYDSVEEMNEELIENNRKFKETRRNDT